MTYVLGIDLETTGFDAKVDAITEVGAVLWHVEAGRPDAMLSALVALEDGRQVPPEIVTLTGLTTEILRGPLARPEVDVLLELVALAHHADFLMAHNAPFDRRFLEAAAERNYTPLPALPWIDTSADLPLPPTIKTRKLVHLAAEHGFLNPFAHRAVFDVLTMLRVAALYPFAEVAKISAEPTIRVVADIPRARNDEAKAVGFRWDPDRREWYREVKACHLDDLRPSFTFPTTVSGPMQGNAP